MIWVLHVCRSAPSAPAVQPPLWTILADIQCLKTTISTTIYKKSIKTNTNRESDIDAKYKPNQKNRSKAIEPSSSISQDPRNVISSFGSPQERHSACPSHSAWDQEAISCALRAQCVSLVFKKTELETGSRIPKAHTSPLPGLKMQRPATNS